MLGYTEEDKFGYYQVGNFKFYSKLEAIEMHTRSGIHPHWNFNEAVFDSYDWTSEPSESILDLYKNRALQLREKYDYIILMYSSGADSECIFNIFIDNNIPLDEVCSLINYEGSGDKTNYLNGEIFDFAIPLVEEAQKKQPNLKHRIIDTSSMTLSWHAEQKIDNWIYEASSMYAPNNIIRPQLPRRIPEWKLLTESGKKCCIIYGVDKPRMMQIDGKYYFQFIDFPVVQNGNTPIPVKEVPIVTELFFWTPDMPKIPIKQAHIIKNYLNRPNIQTAPHITTKRSQIAYKEIDNIKYWLSLDGCHSLVYPNLKRLIVKPPNNPSTIYGRRDDWFNKVLKSCDAGESWEKGIDYLLKKIPEYWLTNPEKPKLGFKGSPSKNYLIG